LPAQDHITGEWRVSRLTLVRWSSRIPFGVFTTKGHRMDDALIERMTTELEAFLKGFEQYAAEVMGNHRQGILDELRPALQRREPIATKYVVDILGDNVLRIGSVGYVITLRNRNLLGTALMGGNNEWAANFADYHAPVSHLLNQALGSLETGAWLLRTPHPTLVINDEELRTRCADLLSSPGSYDRVIREATTILEDRVKRKCPPARLAELIRNEADRTGEKLVEKLFSPEHPVLIVSEEKLKRIAFFKILVGVVSYLRNPYHHTMDANAEWSWAWSTVGFIDRLLDEVDSCTVAE